MTAQGQPEQGAMRHAVSNFALFCHERMKRAFLPPATGRAHRMVVLGVNDEGADARYFADHLYSVDAIEEVHAFENYFQLEPPGCVHFYHCTLDNYLRRRETRQASVHSVYCRQLFEKVHESKRHEILTDVHYLLRSGGWLMLESATRRGESRMGAIDSQQLLKQVLLQGRFRPLFFDIGEFGGTQSPLVARLIAEC